MTISQPASSGTLRVGVKDDFVLDAGSWFQMWVPHHTCSKPRAECFELVSPKVSRGASATLRIRDTWRRHVEELDSNRLKGE